MLVGPKPQLDWHYADWTGHRINDNTFAATTTNTFVLERKETTTVVIYMQSLFEVFCIVYVFHLTICVNVSDFKYKKKIT
jgi:hypothetical protein